MVNFQLQEVHEVQASLHFGGSTSVTLREVERFCEALRAAGAEGHLPIGVARPGGNYTVLSGTVKQQATAAKTPQDA